MNRIAIFANLSLALLVGALGCAPTPAPTPTPTAPAPEPGFEKVAFLIGDWDGSSSGGRFDEHWIAPRGGMMLGVGREVEPKGAVGFFELLRIERRGADLVLVPHPMGKPAGEFRLARSEPGSAVFENAGDDRVSKIAYTLTGSELVARVEFRTDGHVEEYRLRRWQR